MKTITKTLEMIKVLCGVFALALSAHSLSAANATWYGDDATAGGDGTWSLTAPSWGSGGAVWLDGDSAIFNASTSGNVTMDGLVSTNKIIVYGGANYQFNGSGTLALNGATNQTLMDIQGTAVFNNPIHYTGPNTHIDIATGASLTFNGDFVQASSANRTVSFWGKNNSTLTINGNITTASTYKMNLTFGNVGADYSEGGTYILNGTDFSGFLSAFVVTGGTVVFNNAFLTGSPTVTVGTTTAGAGNAALLINKDITVATTVGITAGTVARTLGGVNTSGIARFTGAVNLATNATLTAADGGTVVFSNVIKETADSWGVTKTGNGTVILSGNNTYKGGTTVSAGTLLVNNSAGSGVGTGAVTVNASATLGGTGKVNAITLNSGAKLAPGDGGIGKLSGSDLTWNSGGNLLFDLGAVSTDADLLTLTGSLIKGTGSDFNFLFNDLGVSLTTYDLITFGANSGFSLTDFSYTSSTFEGNFILSDSKLQFQITAMVPEPSVTTLLLIGGGLLLLTALRRRKAKA